MWRCSCKLAAHLLFEQLKEEWRVRFVSAKLANCNRGLTDKA